MDGKRLAKSVAIAAVLGFASFLLSGNGLSWVLAVGVFYYDFMVRGQGSSGARGSKK